MEIKNAVIRFVIAYIVAIILISLLVVDAFKPALTAISGIGLGISLISTIIQLIIGSGPGGLCERIRHYCIAGTMAIVLIGVAISLFVGIFR